MKSHSATSAMSVAKRSSCSATAVFSTMFGSERFCCEPHMRNSNLLPVNANGEVRLRSVLSLVRSASCGTPRSIFSRGWLE